MTDPRDAQWVTEVLDRAGVPSRSYEAQGGGMCDWTLACRVEHLVRLLSKHGVSLQEGVLLSAPPIE